MRAYCPVRVAVHSGHAINAIYGSNTRTIPIQTDKRRWLCRSAATFPHCFDATDSRMSAGLMLYRRIDHPDFFAARA